MGQVVPIRREVSREQALQPLADREKMNPATLLRLAEAWPTGRRAKAVHVLGIGAVAGTWPGTIYRATALGYLERTDAAWFKPTEAFWVEVYRARRLLHRTAG